MERTQQRRRTLEPPASNRSEASTGRPPERPTADGANAAAPFELAQRLHALRKERGLSLDALAQKAGLTKGFLSLVERGLKAPSISTLLKLSHVYGLSVGALLDSAKPQEPTYSLVRRSERRKYAREGSLYGYRYEAIAFGKESKRMEPFIVSPPLRLPRKFFQHDGDEMVYVLAGEVEVHLGSERILLTAGDCLYFDATTSHRSRSIGAERAVTLVIVSEPN